MNKPMFIWLGSGRARKRGVGGDGRTLDEATRAGLPVPDGAVLLDEFYRFCRAAGLVTGAAGRPAIPDAELWHNTLFHSVRLPSFARPVVVRLVTPAAINGETVAAYGRGEVNLNDQDAAAAAVIAAWAAAERAGAARADALILETIPNGQSGWAILSEETDELYSAPGSSPGVTLPRLRGRATPDAGLPPFVRRAQMLLRGVRRTFNPPPRRVAWADDGAICWLLGVDNLS
jgi:hypothetical protein